MTGAYYFDQFLWHPASTNYLVSWIKLEQKLILQFKVASYFGTFAPLFDPQPKSQGVEQDPVSNLKIKLIRHFDFFDFCEKYNEGCWKKTYCIHRIS